MSNLIKPETLLPVAGDTDTQLLNKLLAALARQFDGGNGPGYALPDAGLDFVPRGFWLPSDSEGRAGEFSCSGCNFGRTKFRLNLSADVLINQIQLRFYTALPGNDNVLLEKRTIPSGALVDGGVSVLFESPLPVYWRLELFTGEDNEDFCAFWELLP